MSATQTAVAVPAAGAVILNGLLDIPAAASGMVVFSHGSGSGRLSPRNLYVAQVLRDGGMGTLLVDLLTAGEDRDIEARFDISLLTDRLDHAVRFAGQAPGAAGLPVGLFGASTGAASALRVAARRPDAIRAVVSRGGRPDMAGAGTLAAVRAPTLLIVGGQDTGVIELNEAARDALQGCTRELVLVPGATHLFEELGTLEQVAALASGWFRRWFGTAPGG
jgi:pimeloyl-ACP methyl ester carboxylesterase